MSAVHDYANRLLDLAYGELPPPEAKELEAHVRGCSQCMSALDDIRGVRKVMGQLPPAEEPSAGLESLMAYAEQAARRASVGPEPKAAGWRRWLAPVLGLTAVAALGAVTLTTLASHQAPTASQLLAEEKATKSFGAAPVVDVTPVADSAPEEARKQEAKLQPVLAEEKPALAQKAAVMKSPAAMRNSADLADEFAGNSNMGPLNKDLNRGGASLGDLGGASTGDLGGASTGDLGGAKGSGGYIGSGGERQQQVGSGGAYGEGRTQVRAKKEAAVDSIAASTASERRDDSLMPPPAPRREQPPAEFVFDDRVSNRKADVAYDQTKVRSRAESNDEADYAAAPAAVAQKEAEDRPTVAVVQSDAYEAKKSKAASKPAEDSNVLRLRALVNQAREARLGGNRQLEAVYLRQAVVLPVRGPEHAGALIQLGEVEAALGRYAQSDAAFRQAMALYPSTSTSQMANRKLNENQSQQKTGSPYAPGQHRPADMPKEAPDKRAIDAAEH